MSRWEYIRKLEELLSDIPPGEREEALQYYNDYINDGGKENEEAVLASLGTPEQVAATVKEGLEGAGGEFTERGFRGGADGKTNPITEYQQPAPEPEVKPQEEEKTPPRQGLSGGTVALIVILCILASPLLIGLAGGVFGFLVSAFAIIFSLAIAFSAIAIAFLAVAIFLGVVGISQLFYSPLPGLAFLAVAFIMAGAGILFLLLTVLWVGKLLPALIKGIAYLFGRIFGRKGGNK